MCRAAAPLFLIAAAAIACQDPTQLKLAIRTNALCDDVDGTAITTGVPGELEARAPATTTTACTSDAEGGNIGTLVLIPSDQDDAPVGVKVAMALGGSLEACISLPYADSCIIARRSLGYIPHKSLTLPIELDVDCVGEFCDELTTCVDGRCVDATIDANECLLDPSSCEPQGTGGGGGGGAGGGDPTGCDVPITVDPIAVTSSSAARALPVIAADAGSCSWAIAWRETAAEACMALIGPLGMPVAATSCASAPDAIDDLDVTALGAEAFAVGAWSSGAALASLWSGGSAGFGPAQMLGNAAEGALAANGDTLLAFYRQGNDDALRLASYHWDGTALISVGLPTLSGAGRNLDIVWGGGETTLSWKQSTTAGSVLRFEPGEANATPFTVEAVSSIALGNHPRSDVTGIVFRDTGGAATLATWGPNGAYVQGAYAANDYSETAAGFGVAGTTSGWVVSYVDGASGFLSSFDTTAKSIATVREVASDATAIAIAAIGDQLGVAWLDARGTLWFRRVAFDLSKL